MSRARRRRIVLRTGLFGVGIVVLMMIVPVVRWLSVEANVETCLDAGHAWDYETRSCNPSE